MISIDGIQYRNLEEQVLKNKQDIAEFKAVERVLADFGIFIIGNLPTPEDLVGKIGEAYGNAYAIGTAPPYDYYIWTRADPNSGHTSPYWFNIGPLAIEGPRGPVGPKGPDGAEGRRGSITFIYHATQNTPPNRSQYTEVLYGDHAINLNTGEYWEFNGGGTNGWSLIGSLRGPQGPEGPQGPTGETGPIGPQGPTGPRGDPGAFIHIEGILENVEQLPAPDVLRDLSIAYLIGTAPPYVLWMQVGTSPDDAQWNNLGEINTATFVTVNGVFQNVWSADSKLDDVSKTGETLPTQLCLYGTNLDKSRKMYGIYGTPVKGKDGIPYLSVLGGLNVLTDSIRLGTNVTNKEYVDNAVGGMVDKVTSASVVYGTDENGEQVTIPVSYNTHSHPAYNADDQSYIVRRNIDGAIMIYDDQIIGPDSAVNRKYVDEAIAGAGGSTTAIIDVDSLPTENINGNAFYRVKASAYTIADGIKDAMDTAYGMMTTAVNVVDALPEQGVAFVNTTDLIMTGYLLEADLKLYGYADSFASTLFNVTQGWHEVTEMFVNNTYKVITSPDEATETGIMYIIYTAGGLFTYNGTEWVEYVTKAQLDEAVASSGGGSGGGKLYEHKIALFGTEHVEAGNVDLELNLFGIRYRTTSDQLTIGEAMPAVEMVDEFSSIDAIQVYSGTFSIKNATTLELEASFVPMQIVGMSIEGVAIVMVAINTENGTEFYQFPRDNLGVVDIVKEV